MTIDKCGLLVALALVSLFVGCAEQAEKDSTSETRDPHPPSVTELPSALVAVPLKEVSPNSSENPSGPLFELFSSDRTGVDFVNQLRPENNVPYIYMGAGVAVGDFDNDGLADLYLLSVDSPNKLYRQTGDFRFEEVTERAGVDGGDAWSRGATFFDIDNDGDLDLYVCNTEAPNLLYINQGDGTFVESAKEYGLDFAGASVMASVADFDRDGDLDIYVITHRTLHYSVHGETLARLRLPGDTLSSKEELVFDYRFEQVDGRKMPVNRKDLFENLNHWEIAGQNDALFRQNADGKFTNITEQAGLTDHGLGLSCTWLDFDGDGWLDLHVANDLQTKDRLYRNNHDGTFKIVTAEILPHTSWYSMGSDFGDINNDGQFDFLVVDMASTTHFRSKVQMGDMGQFRYFMEAEWPPQLMRNTLYLNTGTDRFMEVAQMSGLSATDWTWSVKLQDLDNDGRVDAFFTNGIARADEMNPDLKTELEQVLEDEGESAAVDLIQNQGEDATKNLAFRNLGDLHFENVSHAWGLDFKGISYGAAQADLDRDGDLDLIVNNHNAPACIYRNNSQSGHRAEFRFRGSLSNRFGIGTKVTLRTDSGIQVRQLFPVHGYMTCDEPMLHFGLGDDERITQVSIEWPNGNRQTFNDLPVNHRFTITEPDTELPQTGELPAMQVQFADVTEQLGLQFKHAEYPYNDFGSQPLLPGKLSQLGPGLAWGDADGDGDDDLFVGGAAGQTGELFLRQDDGTFVASAQQPWQNEKLCEDMASLWIDVDSDGDLDLLIASGSSEYSQGDPRLANRLYLNDGQGQFELAADALPENADSTSVLAAADFDHDGDLDLFVGQRLIPDQYPLSPASALWRNDDGKFTDVTEEVAPGLRKAGLVSSAIWSDADGDGNLDLFVAVEWGPIRFFHNEAGKLVEETKSAGLAERTGWWNSLAAGDFDGDGDIDYIALNAGLNTKYGKPSSQKPTRLYYGDMHDSGEKNLIEVKCRKDGLLPVRGLSCSSNAMPELKEKFPTYTSFASSLLIDIYQPTQLEEATRYEANELASGVLINDGKAHFRWQPLPTLAQASPAYGATVADLDGDGDTDIYVVGNLFTREPETGAWDGGVSLMLRGDGAGNFEPVSPSQSGLIVSGDAKGLATCDIDHDGWVDFAVTQNDDSLRVFRNRGINGRSSLAVRLVGAPGNSNGVGARVTFRSAGLADQVAEVYAGSGYLSQSDPCLHFGRGGNSGPGTLLIRWPDSTETTRQVEATENYIVVKKPSLAKDSTPQQVAKTRTPE